MSRPNQPPSWIFVPRLRTAIAVFALSLTLLLTLAASQPAQAQMGFTYLYSFTGGADGGLPVAGLTKDSAGNLYGITNAILTKEGSSCQYGPPPPPQNCGTIFKLSPQGAGWAFTTIYRFQGGTDGVINGGGAPLTLALDGSLYGTTAGGGDPKCSCVTVFHLTPNADGTWTHSVIYSFGKQGSSWPNNSGVTLDSAGNLYGTTYTGGTGPGRGEFGGGVVFELTPSNGAWVYQTIHSFAPGFDGTNPGSGVIIDPAGNLYGTSSLGLRAAQFSNSHPHRAAAGRRGCSSSSPAVVQETGPLCGMEPPSMPA